MDEKCVCHINGYRLKDTEARKTAEAAAKEAEAAKKAATDAENGIAATATVANQAKSAAAGANVTARAAAQIAQSAESKADEAKTAAAAALPRAGGIMTGNLDMGGNTVENVRQVNANEAIGLKEYSGFDMSLSAISEPGVLRAWCKKNMVTGVNKDGSVIFRGVAPGVNENDAVNLGQVREMVSKNIGVTGSFAVFDSILDILKHATYDSDMRSALEKLEALIKPGDDKPVYKWVFGVNGSAASADNEAILDTSTTRAMCLAKDTGIPLRYGNGYHVATEVSPYSPVVIPEGAVSVTVKCPGFRIGFNELKLDGAKWIRLFTSDPTPVADEVTYVFKSADASGLYIKLRHITDDKGVLTDIPETADITFNYESDSEPVYEWVVGYNASYANADNEALLVPNSPTRAICAARNYGIPLAYGSSHVVHGYTDISPVVVPEGAKSITVRCPGLGICFNELKLEGVKWYRLFTSDTDAVADEATYAIRSTDASGLYIKLKDMSNGSTELTNVPQYADFTFNY